MSTKIDEYKQLNERALENFPSPSFEKTASVLLNQNYGLHRLLSFLVRVISSNNFGYPESSAIVTRRIELANFLRDWLDAGGI